jgi:hypothetical protein
MNYFMLERKENILVYDERFIGREFDLRSHTLLLYCKFNLKLVVVNNDVFFSSFGILNIRKRIMKRITYCNIYYFND